MVVIYVFLLEGSMYSYCCLCILIFVYVFVLLVYGILIVSLCILIVVYVLSMYSYCSATLTEVFPCFFLSCKANARV